LHPELNELLKPLETELFVLINTTVYATVVSDSDESTHA
jgi:hypothetical protein